MPEAWRIVKAKHAATAFSGKGAADHGGRWNSRGVAVVYVSLTKSLAVLESLVHLNPPVKFKLVAFRLEFDDAWVEKFPLKKLPADWQVEPPPHPPSRSEIFGCVRRVLRSWPCRAPSFRTNLISCSTQRIRTSIKSPFTSPSHLLLIHGCSPDDCSAHAPLHASRFTFRSSRPQFPLSTFTFSAFPRGPDFRL